MQSFHQFGDCPAESVGCWEGYREGSRQEETLDLHTLCTLSGGGGSLRAFRRAELLRWKDGWAIINTNLVEYVDLHANNFKCCSGGRQSLKFCPFYVVQQMFLLCACVSVCVCVCVCELICTCDSHIQASYLHYYTELRVAEAKIIKV